MGIDLAYFDSSSIEMVRLMVDSSKEVGIDLNGTDIHGNTAFMKACKRGHLDIIKLLINSSKEFDIDLNARYIDEPLVLTRRRILETLHAFLLALKAKRK